MERRSEPVRADHLVRAKASIARRLAHVCSELPAQEFDALVERIALVEIKYTMRADDVARLRSQH